MNSFTKLIIAIAVHTILFSHGMAQETFKIGKQVVCGTTFTVSFGEVDPNTMLVESRLAQYKDGYPRAEGPRPPWPIEKKDKKVDTVAEKRVLQEVLKDKLNKLNTNNEEITIRYVFSQEGNVVDISSYSLSRNTLVTPKELALIDKRLRKEVKATFTGPAYLQWPVIFFGREIQF